MSAHLYMSLLQQRTALLAAARLLGDRVRATEVHINVPCGYGSRDAVAVWRWPGVVSVRFRNSCAGLLVQCLPGRPDEMDPAMSIQPMEPSERRQALHVAAGRLAEREKLPQVYFTVEAHDGIRQPPRSIQAVAVYRWPGVVLVRSRADGQLLALSKPGEPFTPDHLGLD